MSGRIKGKEAIIASESDEQSAFVRWFRVQYPRTLIFSIPNGAHLSGTPRQRAAQMARLKSEGLLPGVPDLVVPSLDLWIEMKRTKGGRLSKEQSDIGLKLEAAGKIVIVANGCLEAIEKVKPMMGGV